MCPLSVKPFFSLGIIIILRATCFSQRMRLFFLPSLGVPAPPGRGHRWFLLQGPRLVCGPFIIFPLLLMGFYRRIWLLDSMSSRWVRVLFCQNAGMSFLLSLPPFVGVSSCSHLVTSLHLSPPRIQHPRDIPSTTLDLQYAS